MIDQRAVRMLNRLKAGAEFNSCGGFMTSLNALNSTELFTSLIYDRLQRKLDALNELAAESDGNWNQTFYLMYFRTLGGAKNKDAYLTLARKATYAMILRERRSLKSIEALLFCTSGLLRFCRDDEYTSGLKSEFEHLAAKYNIEPMDGSEWNLTQVTPANHPILRIAQSAEFFMQNEFVMNKALECSTFEQAQQLFCTEASEYWRTHNIPGVAGNFDIPKRIGVVTANIIAINLVAIIQYAYGSYVLDDRLRDRALSLLEKLPAEDNQYIKLWRNWGITPKTALESQGLIQLSTQYCECKRCEECPVGRRILENCSTID